MEQSRLKFAEDEQPLAGQDPPARRMEAAAPKPGAGRPTKRRRMEIARAAGGRLQTEKPRQTSPGSSMRRCPRPERKSTGRFAAWRMITPAYRRRMRRSRARKAAWGWLSEAPGGQG